MVRRKHWYFSWKKLGRVESVVMGLGLLFMVLYGFRLASLWNRRTWIGTVPYRILVLHRGGDGHIVQTEVVSIWPDSHRVLSLSIPPETFIGVVGGYGTYRLAALEELGTVEGVGDDLLRDSVGWLLGMPIHRVVWQPPDKLTIATTRNEILRDGLLGKRSLQEAWEIAGVLAHVQKDTIEHYEFSERNVLRRQTDIDGSQNLYVEQALVDRFVLDNLSALWREAAMIQVAAINASGKPQLATLWSRYIRVGGFDLVSVTEQQTLLNQTKLIFGSKELQNGVAGKALQSLFPRATVEVGDTTTYRAAAAILFGTDSWSWLNERTTYLKNR